MKRTLGTQLRHLIELLDSAVERSYEHVDASYRPRYTPVMRVLMRENSSTISEIAQAAGISQPAVTQTVSRMMEADLVSVSPSETDARQRIVQLTKKGKRLAPRLAQCWEATALAAKSLEDDMQTPLGAVLEDAIQALEKRSYDERIAAARETLGGT
ncbi:MarR family winged helix-turn-helix transcriptional regulator [Roseateles chitinivorans]|uniref:MarR family winged helix-turn-helix transcriptional regulator n=1 Tax=Roseateles chitinivorans TaxID=2917965 RepID=UPI003D66E0F1